MRSYLRKKMSWGRGQREGAQVVKVLCNSTFLLYLLFPAMTHFFFLKLWEELQSNGLVKLHLVTIW
jgi:hypothetical protein